MKTNNEAVLREFERIIAEAPAAFTQPGKTVYQVTADEVVKFAAALAATATVASAEQPAGDAERVAAWFAANDKYIVKADFDAWLEQAYRDGLKEGRALATTAPDTSARDAALEEAAMIAMNGPLIESYREYPYMGDGCKAMALTVASRIRALKTVPGEPT